MRNRLAGLVLAATVSGALISGCEFKIDGTVEEDEGLGGVTPAVSFDGDLGLDKPLTVVKADDVNLVTEIESGVYVSAGALDDTDPASCDFVQTRTVKVEKDVVVEVAVSDDDLDKDQANVTEPDAAVVKDDPTTAETDFKVTLEVGDKFAAEGCEDFVKIAEVEDE